MIWIAGAPRALVIALTLSHSPARVGIHAEDSKHNNWQKPDRNGSAARARRAAAQRGSALPQLSRPGPGQKIATCCRVSVRIETLKIAEGIFQVRKFMLFAHKGLPTRACK